jgi:hypothetical protein
VKWIQFIIHSLIRDGDVEMQAFGYIVDLRRMECDVDSLMSFHLMGEIEYCFNPTLCKLALNRI